LRPQWPMRPLRCPQRGSTRAFPCGANERALHPNAAPVRISRHGRAPSGLFPGCLRSTSIEGDTVMHVQLPARLRARPALASAMILAAFAMPWTAPVNASSHREAPFIATQPQTDATDFYMFRSYEPGRDGYVTLVANYLPIQ